MQGLLQKLPILPIAAACSSCQQAVGQAVPPSHCTVTAGRSRPSEARSEPMFLPLFSLLRRLLAPVTVRSPTAGEAESQCSANECNHRPKAVSLHCRPLAWCPRNVFIPTMRPVHKLSAWQDYHMAALPCRTLLHPHATLPGRCSCFGVLSTHVRDLPRSLRVVCCTHLSAVDLGHFCKSSSGRMCCLRSMVTLHTAGRCSATDLLAQLRPN